MLKLGVPLVVLLDNNILNRLLGPGCPFTVDDLVAAYRSEELEIVGSLELLEELLGTARKHPHTQRSSSSSGDSGGS